MHFASKEEKKGHKIRNKSNVWHNQTSALSSVLEIKMAMDVWGTFSLSDVGLHFHPVGFKLATVYISLQ